MFQEPLRGGAILQITVEEAMHILKPPSQKTNFPQIDCSPEGKIEDLRYFEAEERYWLAKGLRKRVVLYSNGLLFLNKYSEECIVKYDQGYKRPTLLQKLSKDQRSP